MKPTNNIDQEELNLRKRISEFFADPLGYVLYVFPWGKPGTRLENAYPDTWQIEMLKELGEEIKKGTSPIRIAIASGHGIGKSADLSWIIHWFMATRRCPQIVVTANTKNQLEKKTWRELSVWNDLAVNKHWFTHTATKFYCNEEPSKWFASAIPWSINNSEAFAGTHDKHVLMIFDEGSGIPNIIWEVSEGALTTLGSIFIVFGNPTRNSGRFYECFNRLKHRWLHKKIDSRTAKMTDKELIEEWRQDYGEESDYFKTRVRGEFPNSSTLQFIPTDFVDAALERRLNPDQYNYAPIILGVDVAREGDDDSVIAVRQGLQILDIRIFNGVKPVDLTHHIIAAEDYYHADAVFIDEVGVGSGALDHGRNLGRTHWIGVISGSNEGITNDCLNVRAYMWKMMRDWIKSASIPATEKIREKIRSQLISQEGWYREKDNKLQLVSKKDMKEDGIDSPDIPDAIGFTFRFPVRPKEDQYIRAQREEEYWSTQTGSHSLIGGY